LAISGSLLPLDWSESLKHTLSIGNDEIIFETMI
jgi:hypothetical protein